MLRNLLLVILVAVTFESTATAVSVEDLLEASLIVGGEDAKIEEYPYQANLLFNGTHWCGASIISDEWILTATHCVLNTSYEYTVRLGSTLKDSGGSIYLVDAIVKHENYRENSLGIPYDDIAALKVFPPIIFDETMQPIPLFDADEEAEPGANATVSGWGTLAQDSNQDSAILQVVTVPIVSKTQCNTSYAESGGIPYGQICAGYPEGGKDACTDDSGGPLAIEGRLVGIVSWGNGCGIPGCPGVYTEIAWYRDWIKNTTGI